VTTPAERISGWSRRFATASAVFLLAWGVGSLAGIPTRADVFLGLFGFVFHMVFAKGYSLIPTYFDRDLEPSWLPAVQFPLTVLGAACLAAAAVAGSVPVAPLAWLPLATAGALLWSGGVGVFVGGLGWSLRDNLAGRETATGEHNRHREPVDRFANLFVPVALAYLAVGSYGLLASVTPAPPLFDGYAPRVTHLLAAGTATLLVFAIGFRLFPRFLCASPPRALVGLVLPLGAIGPVGLAWSVPAGDALPVFAVLQAVAVVGYAAAVFTLFVGADSRRVGMYGVVLGAVGGLVGVTLGLGFAFAGVTPEWLAAHARVNLLWFLGATVVGVAYQFYPPAASRYPGGNDRTAAVSMGAIAAGVAVEAAGLVTAGVAVQAVGRSLALAGSCLYAYLLVGVFASR